MIKIVKINSIFEPIGYDFKNIKIHTLFEEVDKLDEYSVTIKWNQEQYKINNISVLNNEINPQIEFLPKTRYEVTINQGNDLYSTFFETGMMDLSFKGEWIESDKGCNNSVFLKEIILEKDVKKIRVYMAAKGVYELLVNGTKVGDELLAPGFTKYDSWTQVQTYEIPVEYIESNILILEVSVADGWMKSRIGFDGGNACIYGDTHAIICDLDIVYEDDSVETISSNLDWCYKQGKVKKSGIYYGEDLTQSIENDTLNKVKQSVSYPTTDRKSLPIKVMETIEPQKIYVNEFSELIIDLGQNHSGWLTFINKLPAGKEVIFEYSEFLENGKFYRENLRTARAAFKFRSSGIVEKVNPHFTYFGYQFVKVTGLNFEEINLLENLHSEVIYSAIEFNSIIKSDNKLINRLIDNIIWGQKSNFVDIPTDCPQRDERLGWTGDANIFSKAATLNANVDQFFKKYMKDIRIEQKIHNGLVPDYAPLLKNRPNESAIWGDAITFIPWNVYLATGDLEILQENYQAMLDWVYWILPHTEEFIWRGSYQYGDWLALDATNQDARYGGTDETYVATLYYYMSLKIIEKVQNVLNIDDDNKISNLKDNVKNAIINEYVSPSGSLTQRTQTGYLLMLEVDILDDRQTARVVEELVHRIRSDKTRLQTGFVGTPLLCKHLSKNGHHDLAMEIFMYEGYPGWLYSVKLGATTIWERWNSVMPDGTMSKTMMNSLNHYSYGAILEWIVEYLLGVKSIGAGRKEFVFTPGVSSKIKEMSANLATSSGTLRINWELKGNTLNAYITIPLGNKLRVDVGDAKSYNVSTEEGVDYLSDILCEGSYVIEVVYDTDFSEVPKYSVDTPIYELILDEERWSKIIEFCPYYLNLFEDKQVREKFGKYSVEKYIMVHNITLSAVEKESLRKIITD